MTADPSDSASEERMKADEDEARLDDYRRQLARYKREAEEWQERSAGDRQLRHDCEAALSDAREALERGRRLAILLLQMGDYEAREEARDFLSALSTPQRKV